MRLIHLPRAIFALAGGLFITFSQSHAAIVGLMIFLGFTLLTGITTLIIGRRIGEKKMAAPSLVSLVAGVFAIIAIIQTGGLQDDWLAYSPVSESGYSLAQSQLPAFLVLVAGWALVTAAIEIYLASREGFGERGGRDFLISGIFSAALGTLFLLVAPDVVSAVGFFGAYLILVGVHWGIAAFGDGKK